MESKAPEKLEAGQASTAPDCSTDPMRQLAIAALKLCDKKPHPEEWWDNTMTAERDKDYEDSLKTVARLRKELGL